MKKYVATFNTTQQVSPDDFEVITPSLLVDENTKLSEIETFYRKYNKQGFTYLKIIELQITHNP